MPMTRTHAREAFETVIIEALWQRVPDPNA